MAFGEARDIPLPGLQLGNEPHLAVYRAASTTVYWGKASSIYPFGAVSLDPGSPSPKELMLDDWDGDGKTDFGVEAMTTGAVNLTLSSGGWSTSGIKTFTFPAGMGFTFNVPDPDPHGYLPDERAGGQPILGLQRTVSGANPHRSALALWNPGTRQACLYDGVVAAGSSTAVSCTATTSIGVAIGINQPESTPLGGLRNTATGGLATVAWIKDPVTGSTPTLHRKHIAAPLTVPPDRSLAGARSRGIATFVADMGLGATADGLPEILAEGDYAGQWYVFWSNTDYQTSTMVWVTGYSSRMLLSVELKRRVR